MDKRIIYQNDAGGVSILIPTPNSGLTIEEIATKDVPPGKPFKIVDASDIPADRSNRAAWTVDPTELRPDTPGKGLIKNATRTPAQALEHRRATAELSHDEFLIRASDAGLITKATAEEASGGAWPLAFDDFVKSLTPNERIAAKAKWARSASVSRSDPLLDQVARVTLPVKSERDAALDLLFGIA